MIAALRNFLISLLTISAFPFFINKGISATEFFASNNSVGQFNFSKNTLFEKNEKKVIFKNINKISSLQNEYNNQGYEKQERINNCLWLAQNEIAFKDKWSLAKSSWGLTVRKSNFSVYWIRNTEEWQASDQAFCHKVGTFEFNKVYKIGSRKYEFFYTYEKCNSSNCLPINVYAYVKGPFPDKEFKDFNKVARYWIFGVDNTSRLIVDPVSSKIFHSKGLL